MELTIAAIGFLLIAALAATVNHLIIERITRPPRRAWDWRQR
jgi:hypothetical protein